MTSPPIIVNAGAPRYWRLHVDPRTGGLGVGLPQMRAGWSPQQIVFAARGSGPFVLAYGSATAESAALPIRTLVPAYDTREAPVIGAASPQAGNIQALGGAARLSKPIDAKRLLLWSTLILGVAMLGWMAWRLSRQLAAPVDVVPTASTRDDA